MKILIDARLYGLENAGLGRYIINLVSELSKLDFQNEYVVLLRKKYFDELPLPKNWQKVLADFRHYGLAEQIKIPKIIRDIKPDITHFPHFNTPLFFSSNYVVTIHDMLMHKFKGLSATTLPFPIYFFKQVIYRNIFRHAVLKSEKIIVPSQTVKNELSNFYHLDNNKIKVVYEGFDEKIDFKNDSSEVLSKYNLSGDYFIYAGNAYPHKNLERLVNAIVALNKNTNHKAVLAISSSRNVFTNRLQKVIKNLNADPYVRLLGFVPDSELGTLYKNSKAFVFPSLSEGFGLPGLEAMNCKTLVLASDIPVFREVYGDNAVYFNPLDFSALENGMKQVLEMDNNTIVERKNKAYEFAKKYSWTKMAKEMLAVYNEVVKK